MLGASGCHQSADTVSAILRIPADSADVGLVTLMVALDVQIWINGIVGAIGWISTIFTPASSTTTAETY
jgi:hypothetical protein